MWIDQRVYTDRFNWRDSVGQVFDQGGQCGLTRGFTLTGSTGETVWAKCLTRAVSVD